MFIVWSEASQGLICAGKISINPLKDDGKEGLCHINTRTLYFKTIKSKWFRARSCFVHRLWFKEHGRYYCQILLSPKYRAFSTISYRIGIDDTTDQSYLSKIGVAIVLVLGCEYLIQWCIFQKIWGYPC